MRPLLAGGPFLFAGPPLTHLKAEQAFQNDGLCCTSGATCGAYHVGAAQGRAIMQRNDNRLELIVSLTIAFAVTIIFVVETVAHWPTPFRMKEFQLEFHNPLAVLRHVPPQRIAGND